MNNPILQNKRFPHLLPQDVEVWLRFLQSPANIYDYFEYDIHVGDGRDPGPEFDDKYRHLGRYLSQRRIDAVGHHTTHIALIEITRQAGLKALGQLTAYPVLYTMKYKPQLPLIKILVTERMQTDCLPAFVKENIKTLLYKPPKKPIANAWVDFSGDLV